MYFMSGVTFEGGTFQDTLLDFRRNITIMSPFFQSFKLLRISKRRRTRSLSVHKSNQEDESREASYVQWVERESGLIPPLSPVFVPLTNFK